MPRGLPFMKKAFFPLAIVLLITCAYSVAENAAQASEEKIVKARPLSLDSVRLTGGPLKRAQDLELEYLLQLDPDRMLAYLRRSAKLEPKGKGYGGWDGDGRQLTGHIAGHYLSAGGLALGGTGETRFKDRANYNVNKMKLIRGAQGDGSPWAAM